MAEVKNDTMKPLSKYLSLFGQFTVVASVLFGVFKYIESTKANTEAINTMSVKIDNLTTASMAQVDTIAAISREQRAQGRTLRGLKSSYTNYLLRDKTLTKQEFYEFMTGMQTKQMDEKKNE